ncbi:hypothetical protein Poli38472_005006 [Pythium oligandrum]|uniref:HSF-type DNA-binding domain-containing protein n=1 Tax=Pythium oligandrum TaxID=41045 RepID=A0A8K1CCR5_PYTOL|nr:hypothetical protein Poli38472_005006 [Pythium oligandrum]|eukprot:TMW59937.1 hypothetical protein Poli38472_005006 [Pythium oligandrum]
MEPRRATSAAMASQLRAPSALATGMDAQLPLPLPSPNTTAAAAALFRVNQLPSSAAAFSPTATDAFSRKTSGNPSKRQRGMMAAMSSGFDPSSATDSPLVPLAFHQTYPARTATTTDTMATTTTATTASTDVDDQQTDVRKRNVGIPKFLRFLFQMLEFEDRTIISWSHKGTAFQIRQPEALAERVLPKYFKHNKVSSFQRQLNYFGFKKWTKTQTNICTFSHPFFVRGEKDKMRLIKRKERSTRGANKGNEGANGARTDRHDHDDNDEHDELEDEHEDEQHAQEDDEVGGPPSKRAKTTKGRTPTKRNSATMKRDPHGTPSKSGQIKAEDTSSQGEPSPDLQPMPSTSRILPLSAAMSVSAPSTAPYNSRIFTQSMPPVSAALYRVEAAPVLPVHSDLLLQHQAQQQQQQSLASYARRMPSPYDTNTSSAMGMPEFSGAYATSHPWPTPTRSSSSEDTQTTVSPGKESMMMLSSFKFADSNATNAMPLPSSFDAVQPYGAQALPPPPPNARDYLDVLLESAAMDEQLSSHSSTGSAGDSTMTNAWEPTTYPTNITSHQQGCYPSEQQQQSTQL